LLSAAGTISDFAIQEHTGKLEALTVDVRNSDEENIVRQARCVQQKIY